MKTDQDHLIEYLHKVDTSSPGLYIAKLKDEISLSTYKNIKDQFSEALEKHSPGSTMILLTKGFDPIIMPDDETMERLGWVRK